ncbi:hypothetical protein AB4Y96_22970, partial [Phyllobacterium sp. TAF24]|uniref:hypothetical protein n=1 Tax=Phyllobacterium sp. TAF24 TaxID=3233068 RepID=UPI003F9971CD
IEDINKKKFPDFRKGTIPGKPTEGGSDNKKQSERVKQRGNNHPRCQQMISKEALNAQLP